MNSSGLTVSAVLSAATDVVTDPAAGYQLVGDEQTSKWPTEAVRVFEDPFTVVAVCVFETWVALQESWQDAQGALVELMSEHLAKTEAKAWDGYLVLLTPGSRGEERDALDAIRYDTARVRKLVATAPELAAVEDVTTALLPLLPLVAAGDIAVDTPSLDALADALSADIERPVADALLRAFAEQRPLLEALHQYRAETT